MKSHLNRFDDHIKESGLRPSSQRNALLSIMESDKRHYTVEELYDIDPTPVFMRDVFVFYFFPC